MNEHDIICALSGVAATDEELEITEFFDGANKELPIGWMEVKITLRAPNPRYADIQVVKAALIDNVLAGIPKKQREEAEEAVAIQIDAQFAALESRKENAPTLVDSETLFVAPSDRIPGLREEIEKLFELLGIEAQGWVDEAPEGEEEEEEEEKEEEEEEGGEEQEVAAAG
jgi:hypothetical protein